MIAGAESKNWNWPRMSAVVVEMVLNVSLLFEEAIHGQSG
jgi:hypothetical protein